MAILYHSGCVEKVREKKEQDCGGIEGRRGSAALLFHHRSWVLQNDGFRALCYVDETKILAHGYSIGGGYATAACYFYNIPYLVLDHTFTTFADAGHNVVHCTESTAAAICAVAWDKGMRENDEDFYGGKDLQADGFDSLGKLKSLSASENPPKVFVIEDKGDSMMQGMGQKLIQAAYPDDNNSQAEYLDTLDNGDIDHPHCDFAILRVLGECKRLLGENDEYNAKFEKFLITNALCENK